MILGKSELEQVAATSWPRGVFKGDLLYFREKFLGFAQQEADDSIFFLYLCLNEDTSIFFKKRRSLKLSLLFTLLEGRNFSQTCTPGASAKLSDRVFAWQT